MTPVEPAALLPTEADLERRFGGLRRLYGDAAYARIRAAHVGDRRRRRRRLVGGRGAGAQRRRRADPDRPRPRRRIEHQPPGAGRSARRSARPRSGAAPSASPTSIRAATCTASKSSSSQTTGRRCCAAAPVDVVIDACDQGRAKAALAAWALAHRHAARDRRRGRRQAPAREAVEVDDLGLRHARPDARVAAPAAAQAARRGAHAAASACAACTRASRVHAPADASVRRRRQPELPRLRLERRRDGDLRHGRGGRRDRIARRRKRAGLSTPGQI